METNTTPVPKIRWAPYGDDYWAGYLDDESWIANSYSIRKTQVGGRPMYQLRGLGIMGRLYFLTLKDAEAHAEQLENGR
jgi:hypothetical protein